MARGNVRVGDVEAAARARAWGGIWLSCAPLGGGGAQVSVHAARLSDAEEIFGVHTQICLKSYTL